jgi:hypothetical protein
MSYMLNVKHNSYSLPLITAVVMPKMNGRDLAGQIEAIRPDVRRLHMSGYSTEVIEPRSVGFTRPLHSAKEPTGLLSGAFAFVPGSSRGDAFVTKMSPKGPERSKNPASATGLKSTFYLQTGGGGFEPPVPLVRHNGFRAPLL